jgi:ubiquitin-conjugating enzyme E2 variant
MSNERPAAETTDPETLDGMFPPKREELLRTYPAGQRAVEILSITAFGLLSLYLFWRLRGISSAGDAGRLAAAAFIGYLAADLFSGLVHWGFDTWGSIHMPIVGPNWIRPFREHHWDPKAITRHDFVEANGNNCLVSLPVLIWACFINVETDLGRFAVAFILFLCLGVLLTNQAHKWAHADRVPALVAWLQRAHLILPPDHHDVHHRSPFVRHYCITTGWLNPFLDATRFFRVLERIVKSTTGALPRREDLGKD